MNGFVSEPTAESAWPAPSTVLRRTGWPRGSAMPDTSARGSSRGMG